MGFSNINALFLLLILIVYIVDNCLPIIDIVFSQNSPTNQRSITGS